MSHSSELLISALRVSPYQKQLLNISETPALTRVGDIHGQEKQVAAVIFACL